MTNTTKTTKPCPAALQNALEVLHHAVESHTATADHVTIALATMKGYSVLAATAKFSGMAQKWTDRRTEAMYLGRTIKRWLAA